MNDPGAVLDLPPTIAGLIEQSAKCLQELSESPLLDAEVLLCHCLSKTRSFLRAWPEHQPTPAQITHFEALLGERQRGVPVAHLTGHREFWSRDFIVNADVLIPRPDTELLVELALAQLTANEPAKVIDLGTGSGIVAITVALERPRTNVLACDLSENALRIAKLNGEHLAAHNVTFVQSDWFSAIDAIDFDLILSNPPYIDENDPHLTQGDVRFEPKSALISRDQGLQDIGRLVNQSRQHLKPGGQLLIEHGYDQPTSVQRIFNHYGYCQTTTHNDLSGHPRVTSGIWSPQ